MSPIVANRRRSTRQSYDVPKLLNYAIVGAVIVFVLILTTTSSQKHEGASVKEQQTKAHNEHYRPVLPMEDDFYQTKQHLDNGGYMDDDLVPRDIDDDDGMDGMTDDDGMTGTTAPLQPQAKNNDNIRDGKKRESFVDKYCELGGEQWWPTDDWKTRTPYFLLIGSKKSGTTSLSSWLSYHPRIAPPSKKELLYFLPSHLSQSVNLTSKVLVKEARADYQHYYDLERLQGDETAISYEATPGYVLFSSLSRIPILCTMPWVKLLVTVRDPIDRVFSNYNFLADSRFKKAQRLGVEPIEMPSFDTFINRDISDLKRAGVLRDGLMPGQFCGSHEERKAWTAYQNMMNHSEAPIGRSLYILQLQEWYSGLRELGRDPESELLVVRNEDMKHDPDEVFQKILWWLELPSFTPPSYVKQMVTTYRSGPMSNATRSMLEDLFRPYNQRLFDLLGWDYDVWDKTYQREKQYQEQEEELEEELEEEEEQAIEENMDPKELEHVYDPPDYDEVKGQHFTNQWCVLDKVSWYPPPNKMWQLRAPYFMLPGAKKSGTTSLSSYLMQHPRIENARTKELQFFLNKNFQADYVTDASKTKVREARDHLYLMDYHSKVLKREKSLMSFDATPGYLFQSAALPQRILCVAPWIKLVILLRNPVDRAYSNWAFAMRRNGIKNTPFEQYMQQDMRNLENSGFLNASSPEQEEDMWSNYLAVKHEGPIGRSIYEIQLRQWFQAIRDVGRDPKTQVYILRSEDLKKDLDGEMQKVHSFLGLPHVPVAREKEMVVTNYSAPMQNETRKMLEEFFDPYNQRLYKMLVDNGFGEDWNGFWDPN